MNLSVSLPSRQHYQAIRGFNFRLVRRHHFRPTPSLAVGIGLVGLLFLAALLAPTLSPSPPDLIQSKLRLQAPSLAHPMGTDAFGRDMLARLLYGAQLAVRVSLSTTAMAASLGVALGLLAGYRKGRWDQVLARIFDVWMAFPGLLMAVVVVAWLGPSLNSAIFALAVMSVPAFFRLARSSALAASTHLYVEAARSIGASDRRILLRHLLPNIASPLIVLASLMMGMALLAVSGLTFIGLGAQPPTPEWGALLAAGRDVMDTAWWLSVFPGLAITLSVMGFNLLGDGLRDALAREQNG